MSDSNQQMNANVGLSVSVSGQITVAAVVLIFVVFIFILILYHRAKGYSGTTGSFRSRRLIFASDESTLPRNALDPSILSSLPITIFQSKDFEEDSCLECAVCLCELEDGEEVRLLHKCKHGFHVECIDMWFHSNNTCPLCRSLVTIDTTATETSVEIPIQPLEEVLEAGNSMTNLNEGCSSYAGSSSSSSSSRKRKEGMLMIDIPSRVVGALSSSNTPLPSSKVPSNSPLPTSRLLEEIKSPVFGKMKSLKRMLSIGSFKGVGSSYSPIGCDIEKGGVSESKRQ